MKPNFAHDRALTAYHEAGHVIAARRLGCYAEAEIWWDGTKPTVEHRCVVGSTHYVPTVSSDDQAMLGWAGLLAEHIRVNRFGGLPDCDVEPVWEWGTSLRHKLSATDQEHLGKGDRKAFERAVKIVTENLDAVDSYARQLIRSLPRKMRIPPTLVIHGAAGA